MIKRSEIQKIVDNYDGLRIAVLGSHSALEIMDGAKEQKSDESEIDVEYDSTT